MPSSNQDSFTRRCICGRNNPTNSAYGKQHIPYLDHPDIAMKRVTSITIMKMRIDYLLHCKSNANNNLLLIEDKCLTPYRARTQTNEFGSV